MNLYRISQEVNNDYDTYDSAVVAAKNEDEARLTHPSGSDGWDREVGIYNDWCPAKYVKVELIGTAIPGTHKVVICASFNAG